MLPMQVHRDYPDQALAVAGHMTHALTTASKYYKRRARASEAAKVGGFLQKVISKPPARHTPSTPGDLNRNTFHII